MSPAITDTTDQALTSVSVVLAESTDSAVLTVKVPCLAHRWLTTDDNANLRVLARRTGTGASFVDIQTSPIDLTPYDGTTQQFDLKLHANAISVGLLQVGLPVRVTANL